MIFHVRGKALAASPGFQFAMSQNSIVASMIECATTATLNYPPEVYSLRRCHLPEVS